LTDWTDLRIDGFPIRQFVNSTIRKLFHFLVRRMLAANAAELFQLQALRHGLPVLGGRIVPLFAIAALQGNDLSGHKNSS
jgi:hypothetical protein